VINNSVRQQQPNKGEYEKGETKTLPNMLGACEIGSKTAHAQENCYFRFKTTKKDDKKKFWQLIQSSPRNQKGAATTSMTLKIQRHL
jgi:hypothetical protein